MSPAPAARQLSLVVLAAGLGSRYGGTKQLESVGPGGEALLEYGLYDAVRSGFSRLVLVVRPDLQEAGEKLLSRIPDTLAYTVVVQRIGALPGGREAPGGRTKPWGTAHAVWSAKEALDGRFGVMNADDFYGSAAFRALGAWLRRQQATGGDALALVAYPLAATLSPHGGVTRAICRLRPDGGLARIVEHEGLRREGNRIVGTDAIGATHRLEGDELVSMNLWGFSPTLLPRLERAILAFLEQPGAHVADEIRIPDVVAELTAAGEVTVEVLTGTCPWFGITHPGDRADAQQKIRALVAAGRYPERLWASA